MHAPSQEALKAERERIRDYQAEHADDLPKCDQAFADLHADQIDLWHFRQLWTEVRNEPKPEPPQEEKPNTSEDATAEEDQITTDDSPVTTEE